MSPADIIELPWQPGNFARRALVEALDRAGRPWCNDVDRLFDDQLEARLAYERGEGAPADDPRRPDVYRLAHCRLGAADIDATGSRVAALSAAGLVRPYDYEPWHWELPNIWAYDIVTAIPATASGGATPFNPVTVLEDSIMSANPIFNVIDRYGLPWENGRVFVGLDDGSFEPLAEPFPNNVRGVIGVAFLGSKDGGKQDTIPTLSQDDFNVARAVWAQMCKGRTDAAAVWAQGIHAQNTEGQYLFIKDGVVSTDGSGEPLKFNAAGYIASTNALVTEEAKKTS